MVRWNTIFIVHEHNFPCSVYQWAHKARIAGLRKIDYYNEINKSNLAVKYEISKGTARGYMRIYRDVNNLSPQNRV